MKLYNLVDEYGMLNRVIWEINDRDFWFMVNLNKHLIYQFDDTWSLESADACLMRRLFSSQIILSKWFPDYSDLNYKEFISKAHKYGYLVKCSNINNKYVADSLFNMGVDLIVTDSLLN